MRLKRLPTTTDDILAYRAGSLRSVLAAACAVLAGVLVLKIALMLRRGDSTAIALLGLLGVGLIVGGAIALVRSLRRTGIIIDRAQSIATTWQSFIRRATTTRELGAFWTVLLSPGRLQKRYAAQTVYLVGLHGEVGEPLLLWWDSDYQAARRFAAEIADFLRFPLSDAAGTDAVIHPPGKGAHPPPVQPLAWRGVPCPTTLQCRIAWYDDVLVVEEPRIGWLERLGGPLLLFFVLAPALLAAGAYARYASETPRVFLDPLIAAAIVVAMLSVVVIAVVLTSLPQLAQRRIVEASRAGLHFRREGPFASQDRHMHRADIRELRIAFGHLAAVTPRDYRIICGRLHHPLARAELEWLRDQLTHALSPPAGT